MYRLSNTYINCFPTKCFLYKSAALDISFTNNFLSVCFLICISLFNLEQRRFRQFCFSGRPCWILVISQIDITYMIKKAPDNIIQRFMVNLAVLCWLSAAIPLRVSISRWNIKSPARTHHISLVKARYPSEYLEASVITLPERSTAFTCRSTELLLTYIICRFKKNSNIFLLYLN